jgi:hypothetical protein
VPYILHSHCFQWGWRWGGGGWSGARDSTASRGPEGSASPMLHSTMGLSWVGLELAIRPRPSDAQLWPRTGHSAPPWSPPNLHRPLERAVDEAALRPGHEALGQAGHRCAVRPAARGARQYAGGLAEQVCVCTQSCIRASSACRAPLPATRRVLWFVLAATLQSRTRRTPCICPGRWELPPGRSSPKRIPSVYSAVPRAVLCVCPAVAVVADT